MGGHGDCQEKLVFEVLEWGGQVGGLLAPHFTPSVTSSANFLSLYASLGRHASVSPDHTFMLLSKVRKTGYLLHFFTCALTFLSLIIFFISIYLAYILIKGE